MDKSYGSDGAEVCLSLLCFCVLDGVWNRYLPLFGGEQLQSQDLIFKNKVSPYTGMQVAGRVDKTYLRGKKVFDASAAEQFLRTPAGQLLL